eukprot:5397413-Amphidinium_carterae.1
MTSTTEANRVLMQQALSTPYKTSFGQKAYKRVLAVWLDLLLIALVIGGLAWMDGSIQVQACSGSSAFIIAGKRCAYKSAMTLPNWGNLWKSSEQQRE